MNTVTLIGNLATDVELREVGEDKKVASFLLAVDRARGTAAPTSSGSRRGTGRPSSAPSTSPRAGASGVDGRLKCRTWEQDGKRRDAVEVVARRVEFLGGTSSAQRRRGERR